MKDKTLFKNIEEYMVNTTNEKKTISYSNGKDAFNVEVNENIDLNDIHAAIETIVENVIDQDWAYDLIDILSSYYIIDLFTNIPAPMMDNDIPDYEKCLEICLKLNLKQHLCEISDIVFDYISMLERNIWRKLEYKKTLTALIPWESLMDGLNQFYEVLDTLSEFAEKQKDVDIEALTGQINDVATKLQLVEDMKK